MVEGQVKPFWLDTADGEKLFCWHVLPLDVYLENEHELVMAARPGEVVDELKGTLGERLLRRDTESRVVVNFHGVSSFLLCVFLLVSYETFICFVFSHHFSSFYVLATFARLPYA